MSKKGAERSVKKRIRLNPWAVIYAMGALMVILTMTTRFVGYDESYTLCLIEHSFSDIVRITAKDVHPPLYYLLLKLLTMPFQYHLAAVRLVTTLPAVGMIVLSRYWITSVLGERTGIWCAFLVLTLPASQTYLFPEIRMYGLAALWVMIQVMAIYRLGSRPGCKLQERGLWLLAWSSGLAAAYTQYYALIAVAWGYLLLLAVLCYQKRSIKGWLASVLASILLYLPWLLVLFGQVGEVKAGYWIPPMTLRSYFSYAAFPLYSSMPVLSGALLGIVLLVLVSLAYYKKSSRQVGEPGLFLCLAVPYLGMILTGIAASLAIRPVFSVRYIKCVLGLAVLGIAYVIASIPKKRLRVLFLTVFSGFALANASVMLYKNSNNRQEMDAVRQYTAEHLQENAVILHLEENHLLGIGAYELAEWKQYLPKVHYQDEFAAFDQVLRPIGTEEDLSAYDKWVIQPADTHKAESWNEQNWIVLEASPAFTFLDSTDEIRWQLVHITEAE